MIVEKKTCTECKQLKALSCFSVAKKNRDGLQYVCKDCAAAGSRQWYAKNKGRAKNTRDAWYENNQDKVIAYRKKWVEDNPWFIEHHNEKRRQWYENNKDRASEYGKNWRTLNKDRINVAHKEYTKARRKEDFLYNMIERVRNLTQYGFKSRGFAKSSATHELLGCSWEDLCNHIEEQFLDGMTWDNRSEWHIDHIIPLASARSEEALRMLCHHTNLRPLWARDNILKSDFIEQEDGLVVRARSVV